MDVQSLFPTYVISNPKRIFLGNVFTYPQEISELFITARGRRDKYGKPLQ
jgi:hypothetical protein